MQIGTRVDVAVQPPKDMNRLLGLLQSGFETVRERLAQRRTIARLHELDDHILRDIGLERADIEVAVYSGYVRPRR